MRPLDENERYRYVLPNIPFEAETRHEALELAVFFDKSIHDITAIRTTKLSTALVNRPEHLGDKHFEDHDVVATTYGPAEIDRHSTVKFINDERQQELDSHFEITCPNCNTTHRSDGTDKTDRVQLIETLFECCEVEWFPPSDWRENCAVCGDSHRGDYCTRLDKRDTSINNPETHTYTCHTCSWDGSYDELDQLWCPDCGSPSIEPTTNH